MCMFVFGIYIYIYISTLFKVHFSLSVDNFFPSIIGIQFGIGIADCNCILIKLCQLFTFPGFYILKDRW